MCEGSCKYCDYSFVVIKCSYKLELLGHPGWNKLYPQTWFFFVEERPCDTMKQNHFILHINNNVLWVCLKKCCGGVVFVYLLKSMVAHVLNLSRILKILHQFMHKMSMDVQVPMEDVHGIYIYLHFNPKKSQSK